MGRKERKSDLLTFLIKEYEISRKEIENATNAISKIIYGFTFPFLSVGFSVFLIFFEKKSINLINFSNPDYAIFSFIGLSIILLITSILIMFSISLYSFILSRIKYEVFYIKPKIENILKEKQILLWDLKLTASRKFALSVILTITLVGLFLYFLLVGVYLYLFYKINSSLDSFIIKVFVVFIAFLSILNFIYLILFLYYRYEFHEKVKDIANSPHKI